MTLTRQPPTINKRQPSSTRASVPAISHGNFSLQFNSASANPRQSSSHRHRRGYGDDIDSGDVANHGFQLW